MLSLEFVSPASAVVAVLVIFLTAVYYYIKNRNILPGPTGIPYFGIFPFIKNDTAYLQLEEYGKKYGDLYSFTFMGSLIINLGSAKAFRDVLLNKADYFAGRPTTFNILAHTLNDGIIMSSGESWKTQRKFFIQSFKTHGLTGIKDNTIGPIFNSISSTIKDLNTRKGIPFDVIALLTSECTETIRKILFGDSVQNKTAHEMSQAFASSIEGLAGARLLLFGPVGRFLFKTVPVLRRTVTEQNRLKSTLLKTVRNVEAKMDYSASTCVAEDWFIERKKRREKNDISWQYFTDKALVESLDQIVGDGIHTVAFFIGCFLCALAEHKQEQEKIYKEIIEVVGTNRLPEPDDKKNLPYTSAFMNEVTRTSSFFPIFPSVACTKETTVRGYRIPKDSIVLLNMWQTHHNPMSYENPYKFDPSRFLAKEGKPKAEMPVIFGLGRRVCVGEPYVMLQVFLFLTSIVKNFVITDPNPSKQSKQFLMTGVMELSFTPRKEK